MLTDSGWADRLRGLPEVDLLARHAALHRALDERGAHYRFNERRLQTGHAARRTVLSHQGAWQPIEHEVSGVGVDVVTSMGVTASFHTSVESAQVRQLGRDLHQVQNALPRLLSHPGVAEFLGRAAWLKEERAAAPYVPYDDLAPVIRIDYAFTPEGALVLYDVNLLPAFVWVSDAQHQAYLDVFRDLLPEGVVPYDPYPFVRMMAGIAREYADGRARFVVRRQHGLYPDSVLGARMLAAAGVDASVLALEDLDEASVRGSCIWRMMRRFSKHTAQHGADHQSAEQMGFDLVLRLARERQCTPVPGFHLHLEDHSFAHWLRRSDVAALLHADDQEACARLASCFPSTSLLREGSNADTIGVTYPDGSESVLSRDAFVAFLRKPPLVIKRGDSTGSRDLHILVSASVPQATAVADAVFATAEEGWVAQEFVTPRKSPICYRDFATGGLVHTTGYTKYAAYFARGELTGGHVLVSPRSRKVHGGTDTYLSPLFFSPDP